MITWRAIFGEENRIKKNEESRRDYIGLIRKIFYFISFNKFIYLVI